MSLQVVPDTPRRERSVRPMQFTDLEAVAALEARTFTLPWSLAIFSGQLARESGICLVCEDDGYVVAYLVADMFVDVWHLMNLCVDDAFHRQHVASRLLEAYFGITERKGHRGHTLEVRVSNAPGDRALPELRLRRHGRPPRLLQRRPRGCRHHVEGLGRGQRVTAAAPRPAASLPPILAVETSCDDTSAAVVRGRDVLSSIVSSQNELHAQFGGVVPEVASRRHTELVNEVVAEAMTEAGVGWDDVGAVAVTQGPGLIGALLVGLATAKSLAWRRGPPLIPVNHLQGHIAANYALGVEAPFICLVASGGHTLLGVVEEGVRYRVAAKTMDDAAGEAFDKGARLLGLGYPGGRELDELAARGDPGYARFPRAVPRGRGFSFSGLKTAPCCTTCATATRRRSRRTAPTSPRPTRRRSSASWSRRRWLAPAPKACGASPSPAEWPPTPVCAGRSPRLAKLRACSSRCRRSACAPTTPA